MDLHNKNLSGRPTTEPQLYFADTDTANNMLVNAGINTDYVLSYLLIT